MAIHLAPTGTSGLELPRSQKANLWCPGTKAAAFKAE
jgi:hypothetical protein